MPHPRSSTSLLRLSAVLVLLLAAFGAFVLLREDGAEPGVARAAAAPAPASPGTPAEAVLAAPGTTPGDRPERREVAPVAVAEAVSAVASRKPREVPVGTEGAATVRVQLVDPADEPVHRAGVEVEVQSWISEGEETFRHRVVTDERGIGTLAFAEDVHVDWFKHEPGWGSGLPFLYSEHHIDVSAGDEWSDTLVVTEGGSVSGRVVDTEGDPVAGVELHLFQNYYMERVADVWRPGIAIATTDEDGAFSFPSLAALDWSLAVPPFEWLQLEPSLADTESGRSAITVEAGQALDVGTFVVAPLERLEVHVVDLDGEPLAEAFLSLEPLRSAVPGLRVPQQTGEQPDRFELWLNGAAHAFAPLPENGHAWGYETLFAQTDADGRATLLGTRGLWQLTVQPGRVAGSSRTVRAEQEVELPAPPLTVELPAQYAAVAGQVVSHDDTPLVAVRVVARDTPEAQDDRGSLRTLTDEEGRFRFPELPLGAPLWFHFEGDDVLPAVHAADLSRAAQNAAQIGEQPSADGVAAAPAPRYRVRAAARLNLRLQVTGAHHRSAWMRIVPEALDPLRPPASARESEHLAKLRASPPRSSAVGRGREYMSLSGLFPGTYRVEVLVNAGTGRYHHDNGAPITESAVWTSGVFRTGDTKQLFEIDLSGYEPPRQRPSVPWTGTVRDAVTGQGLRRVWVVAEAPTWRRRSRTGRAGELEMIQPDEPFTLRIAHPGYAVLERTMAPAGELGRGQELQLQPLSTRFELSVWTSDGVAAPEAYVRFTDSGGDPVQVCWDDRTFREFFSQEGLDPMPLSCLPPGSYRGEIQVGGIEVGTVPFTVRDTSELQDIRLSLGLTAKALRQKILDD